MVRENPRHGQLVFAQHVEDAPVDLLAPAVEKALVGRVAHQGMLEDVVPGLAAARKHQLDPAQVIQRRGDLLLRHRRDLGERVGVELASDHAGNLGHLLDLREPVETGHERVVKARRHAHIAALHKRLGQFLDEQRHAIGALYDRRHGRWRKLVATQTRDDLLHAPAPQPVQGEGGEMRE